MKEKPICPICNMPIENTASNRQKYHKTPCSIIAKKVRDAQSQMNRKFDGILGRR